MSTRAILERIQGSALAEWMRYSGAAPVIESTHVVAAVLLSVLNNYLLPDVFYDLPARFGLDFDLSAISSGIYGVIIVVVMLLFPEGFGAYADGSSGRRNVRS